MSVRLQIHDQEFLKMVASATNVGIVRATTFFHSQAKLALNVPNTGVRVSADSVWRQAQHQLRNRAYKKGLVKIKARRTWKDASGKKQSEDVEAWYQFHHEDLQPRIHNGKLREVKSVTIYPYPSKPGEPPRKRTGWLQRHVLMEFAEAKAGNQTLMASRTGVGRNAIYGLYLELGTRRVKPRPWLVATLLKHRGMIGQLMASQS